MTPKKILIFILAIFFVLLLLSVVFPSDGIKIGKNLSLNFISFEEIIDPTVQEQADISEILEVTDIEEEEPDSAAFQIVEESTIDSVMVDSEYVYYEPVPIKIDSVVQHIEFRDRTRSSLNKFFEILANIRNQGNIIRIMHYGDSQIETDRITDYFRYKLQTQFGGVGPGLVPAVKAFDFKSPMIQTVTGDWKRHTIYGRVDTTILHRRYGMMGNFCRFTEPITDTAETFSMNELLNPNKVINYATVSIENSPYSFRTTKQFQRCKMFYGYNKAEVKVKVFTDENLISEDVLPPVEDYATHTWSFEEAPQNIRFEFEAEDSPEFYGFSLEGYSGINVDNIAMRGSGGLFFTRMDLNLLSSLYSLLNTKLLILQFGGNIVPGMRENYDWYRRSFSYQLRTLKQIAPDISIVVIGLADMSMKEKDVYVTYPNIPLIRDALKQACFDNDCAYWDMFEAMGGENSMPSWVFHDPPLGEKDFTHFTPQGARYIAKMFYNAFMFEYNRYLRKRN
jgi:lysophospholipase L1-like esterase